MLKDLKILGRESVIYGLSTAAARFLNFLLLPFYTHYLTTSEYGIVGAVFAYIAFLNIVYQYGMDQAYMRYFSPEGSRTEVPDCVDSVRPKPTEFGCLGRPDERFSTPFWALAATSALFSLGLALGAPFMASAAGVGEGSSQAVRWAAAVLALDALVLLPFAHLRMQHRPWFFASVRIASITVNVAANIVFVGLAGMGINGVFLAAVCASAASLLFLIPVFRENLRPFFSKSMFSAMLRFGLPLVPAGLGAMAVQVIDRPILLRMTDSATVGIYQANYRLGIIMMLAVGMFDQAWRPFFLERAGRPDAGRLFGRVLTYFTLGGTWLVMALSFFMPEFVSIKIGGTHLIHQSYWPGLKVVPVVLAAYLFYGLYINFMVSIVISKRTDILAWTTFLGAGVNIACNLLMIPRWGMMGAAWATFLAYLAMACALYLSGRKIYPVPYEYGRLACIAASSAAVLAAVYLASGASGTLWILSRIAALLAFPLLLLPAGFFSRGEKEVLGRLLGLGKV
ncbi:MAG: oligosaccharide flippase family protein [bacterium]